MRRAIRAGLLAAFVVGIAAVASGIHLVRRLASAGQGVLDLLEGPTATAHAIAGHATAALACVVASIAFVLGLQGLLESGGRRVAPALLFLAGPAIMWLALAVVVSGRMNHDAVGAGLVDSEIERITGHHAAMLAPALGASLAVAGLAAAWLSWRRPPAES